MSAYKSAIETVNGYQVKSQSQMCVVFDTYQAQEEEWITGMKNSLTQLLDQTKEKIQSLQYDVDNELAALDGVTTLAEVSHAIELCGGYENRKPMIDFQAYEGTHPSYKNLTGLPIATVPHQIDSDDSTQNTPPKADSEESVLVKILESVEKGENLESDMFARFTEIVHEATGR